MEGTITQTQTQTQKCKIIPDKKVIQDYEDVHLFRGRRIDNNELVYGDLIHRQIWSEKVYVIRCQDDGFDSYEEYDVIPDTIEEWTKKVDSNGVKVFQGDTLACYGKDGFELGEVYYDNTEMAWYIEISPTKHYLLGHFLSLLTSFKVYKNI